MLAKRLAMFAALLTIVLSVATGCRKDLVAPGDDPVCTMINGVLVCAP